MRWDRLFDDLESQLEHELGAEETDLGAEEERLRLGRLALRDRLLVIAGLDGGERAAVRIRSVDGATLVMTVSAIGRDWIAGEVADTVRLRSVIVPLAAIVAVLPNDGQLSASLAAEPAPDVAASLSARLGLSFVLRDLCRRRVPVEIVTASSVWHGTLDRVGRDHLDLALHELDEPRRAKAVRGTAILGFSTIAQLRY